MTLPPPPPPPPPSPPSFDPFGDLPEVEPKLPQSPPPATPASPFKSSTDKKGDGNPSPLDPFSEPVAAPAPPLDPFGDDPITDPKQNSTPPAFDPFASPTVPVEKNPDKEDVPLGDVFGSPPPAPTKDVIEAINSEELPAPPAFDPFEN